MPIGAIVGGALGAAGSVGSALIGSKAASKASDQQAAAAQNALNLQSSMFDKAQGALSPYYTAGTSAIPGLQALLNPGTSANALAQMPGFKFQSDWGTRTAQNALAAQGLGGSAGPVGKAISDYNNGLAGTTWQNTVGALQAFMNSGVGAASSLAGNATQAGANMGQSAQNLGNAQASGTLGSANALSGGIQGATGSISNALLYSKLFGPAGGGRGGPVAGYGSQDGLYGPLGLTG